MAIFDSAIHPMESFCRLPGDERAARVEAEAWAEAAEARANAAEVRQTELEAELRRLRGR